MEGDLSVGFGARQAWISAQLCHLLLGDFEQTTSPPLERGCETTSVSRGARLQVSWLLGTFAEMGPGISDTQGSVVQLPHPPSQSRCPLLEPRATAWLPGEVELPRTGPCLLLPRRGDFVCRRRWAEDIHVFDSLVRIPFNLGARRGKERM